MINIKNALLLAAVCVAPFHLYAQSHYEKALQAYEAQEFNESYIHLKNALKDNPSDLAAKILMGEMLLINGYFNEAVTEFEEALDFGADPNLVLKSYGKALILTQNFSDILLLEFDNLNTTNQFELYLLRATAYANKNDSVNAEKSYLQAHALKPSSTRALNSLAILYLKQQQFAESQKYIDLSMTADNAHASTWRLKGLLQKQQNMREQALTSFQKAYELNPNDPFVLRAYADGLWEAKRIAEAETIVNQILAQTPEDPYAILLQSQILSASNKTEEAEKILGKLAQDLTLMDAQTLASNISLRFASGMTAYLTNNYEQALSDIIYYVNNSDIEINTLGVLADTYIKLNKERNALKLLESHEDIVTENLNISLLLCDLYLSSNRAFKCETLANTLKQKYPDNSKVDFIKAKTLVARSKIDEAINLLKGINDPAFKHQKQLAIAHLYFQTEQYAKSFSIAQAMLSELPEDIDILNLNVALLIKKQDWDNAQKHINTILTKQPDYAPTKFNQANLFGAQGNYQAALKILSELENKGPLPATSYLLYADLLASIDKPDEAIEKLRYAAKLDDKSLPISDKLIELYIATDRLKEALWEIDSYTKKVLSDQKYILTKAELMHKLGRPEDSKELLQQQALNWINTPEKLMNLSQTQLNVRDFQGAQRTLEKVLSLTNNQYLPALLKLTNIHQKANRLSLAQHYLSIAKKQFPEDASVLVAQAKLDISKGNLYSAEQHLWNALKNIPDYFPAYAQLYQLSNKGQGTDKFVSHVETLLVSQPKQHLMRNLVADTYLQSNQISLAKPHYEKLASVESYPNLGAVLNNLGFILIDSDIERASELVERGLALNPKSASLMDTKGWISAQRGEFTKALKELRQAYSMNSNDPSIRYHLAYTLDKLNRKPEAKRELQQALAMDIAFPQSQAAQALLDSL